MYREFEIKWLKCFDKGAKIKKSFERKVISSFPICRNYLLSSFSKFVALRLCRDQRRYSHTHAQNNEFSIPF